MSIFRAAVLFTTFTMTACGSAAGPSAPPTANASEIARLSRDPVAQRLLAIAKAKIEAEHQALMTGDASVLDPVALSIANAAATQMTGEIAETQLRRHDGIARCGARYPPPAPRSR